MRIINKDTGKHIFISCILFITVTLIFKSMPAAIIGVFTLGIIKEVFDHLKKKKNTYLETMIDTLANTIGMIIGFVITRYIFT